MNQKELKDFLDSKVLQYQHPRFIESDPIQVPHTFSKKEDIEITGFLTATIAWGNRKSIIQNAKKMMQLMAESPYDFVMHHSPRDLERLSSFVHRTFNGTDLQHFVKALRHLYENHGGMETVFTKYAEEDSMHRAIHHFKRLFFEIPHLQRTQKHVSDPMKNSAAKRIHMFLRWMVRKDPSGVDFGIWKNIQPSQLSCPLDVHTGNIARKLGILQRTQNDLKAVKELDHSLRKMDSTDPVKYDFALFGLGAFEKF